MGLDFSKLPQYVGDLIRRVKRLEGLAGGAINITTTTVAVLDSPAFTGTPSAPTAPDNTNTTQIATTAYVESAKAIAQTYTDSSVVGLLNDRGNYDASVNVFPSTGGSGAAGAIRKGDIWLISVAGTLGGAPVSIGDVIRAIVNTPGQTAGNWKALEGNLGFTPLNKSGDTMLGNLLFTDNTYDIGAVATNRPRNIYVAGVIQAASSITSIQFVGTGNYPLAHSSRGFVGFSSDGVISLLNNALNDFNRLQFGGTTNAFPALKRSGTTLQARLGDDSGDADISFRTATVGQSVLTYAASVTIDLGATELVRLLTLTGDITFAVVSNKAAGKQKRVIIVGDTAARNLVFPAWTWMGDTAPTQLAASKIMYLDLYCYGTTEASVLASYVVSS